MQCCLKTITKKFTHAKGRIGSGPTNPCRPVMEKEETQQTSQKGRHYDDRILEPDPSFKRTQALLHQVTLLQKAQNPDYVVRWRTLLNVLVISTWYLMQPGHVDYDIGRSSPIAITYPQKIPFLSTEIRTIFLISRRRSTYNSRVYWLYLALKSGDRIAVNLMCQILLRGIHSIFDTWSISLRKGTESKLTWGKIWVESPMEEKEWAKHLLQSFENMWIDSKKVIWFQPPLSWFGWTTSTDEYRRYKDTCV